MPTPAHPAEAVEAHLEVVAAREPTVRAFAHLDAEGARTAARTSLTGPLAGVVLGIKDLFDTADLPTEYGSPIYAGHRPRADAAAVALLRAAGAVALGKTVTTELAWMTPGPTTNPHRATHTPGGSSSGSAAAVAAGMVDLALGSQTAGSTIRPASYCGVYGLKPTFGVVPTAGVKQAAPSLDTVGVLAADLDILQAALAVLAGLTPVPRPAPRFALVRTDQWDYADGDSRAATERAADLTGAVERQLPGALLGLVDGHELLQAYEGSRALAFERQACADLLSPELRAVLDWGAAADPAEVHAVKLRAERGRSPEVLDALFGEADVLVTPAVLGEAPEGLASTGGPRFCRLWTLLGLPSLAVPGFRGGSGLPVGVQLVARPYDDAVLVEGARRLRTALDA